MRICALTSTFLPKVGGHEAVVDQLTAQFNNAGCESVVLAQHASVKGTKAILNLPYRVVRFRKPFSQVWDIGVLRRALFRLHREWPFDIIHSHSSYPTGFMALEVGSALNLPVVVTPHGSDIAETSRFRDRPTIMARIRKTLEEADAVTAISAYLKNRATILAPSCANHLFEISNGINCDAFHQPAPQPDWIQKHFDSGKHPFFLFLGRFHPRKGVDVLIEAFSRVAKETSNIQLVIAGDGTERDVLQQQARQSGATDRIHFLGVVQGQDKLWFLQNARALVVPTKTWEGLPMVVLEGIAAGRAIIGTKVGGIVDLVKDNENGLLAQPDDAQSLAENLRLLAQDLGTSRRMGENSREKAKLYAWPQVTARYIALFQKLIAAKKEGRPVLSNHVETPRFS